MVTSGKEHPGSDESGEGLQGIMPVRVAKPQAISGAVRPRWRVPPGTADAEPISSGRWVGLGESRDKKRNLPPWQGRFLLVSGPELEPRPKTERGLTGRAREAAGGVPRAGGQTSGTLLGRLLRGRLLGRRLLAAAGAAAAAGRLLRRRALLRCHGAGTSFLCSANLRIAKNRVNVFFQWPLLFSP